MSLREILFELWRDGRGESDRYKSVDLAEENIKALIQELVDDSFTAGDENAYDFWKKVEAL